MFAPIALPFLLALLASAILVPICKIIAFRLGYTVPSSDARPSSKAKARFGGVAIALTLLGCATALGAFEAVPVLLLSSVALFLIGLTSDVFPLKPSTKLIAIIATATVFLFFDYRLHWSDSPTIDSIVTVFWIVGVTSAFNLLDNMDGLCGGIALIAGTAFLLTVFPVPTDGPLFRQMQYLAVLLGAISGFLIYNIHPASVAAPRRVRPRTKLEVSWPCQRSDRLDLTVPRTSMICATWRGTRRCGPASARHSHMV